MASIYDILVRLTGDGQGLRDDLERDKTKIEELLDSIHNKDLTIDANIADAEAKLDDFKATLEDLRDATAAVHLDDAEAQAALDDLKVRLADLTDRALDITVDDETAVAQIIALKDELASIRDQYAAVLVEVDTVAAQAALDDLDAKVEETKLAAEDPAVVELDTAEAQARLDATYFNLERLKLEAEKAAQVDVSVADAQARVAALHAELEDAMRAQLALETREARIQLDAFRAEVMDYHDTIALLLDDREATDELLIFEARLEALTRQTVDLTVDDAEAQATLLALRAELDALRQQAPDFITLQTTEAQAKLTALQDELMAMQDVVKDIPVDVNDADAVAKVDDLKVRLADLGAEISTVHLSDVDAAAKIDDLMLKLGELRAEAAVPIAVTVDEKAQPTPGGAAAGAGMALGPVLLGGLAAGLGPALMPVIAGGAMGLASMFGAAAAGVGAFAAVAVPALRSVLTAQTALVQAQAQYSAATTASAKASALQAERAALAGLSSGELQDLHALQAFEGEYHKFVAQFQPTVFAVFANVLKLAMAALKDLTPVIDGAGTALNTLFKEGAAALNAPWWHQFFQFLGGAAHAAILTFGETLGNLAKAFGGLMQGFQPFTVMMEKGLVHMTAGWAKWAATLKSNTEFQQFLAYVMQAGPAVMHALGALVSLIMQLAQRMGPLSLVVVHLIADLAKFVQSVMRSNTFLGMLVGVVLKAATGLLELADMIVRLFTWLNKAHPAIMNIIEALGFLKLAQIALNIAMAANPIGLIITALALLGLAAYELIKHWKAVETFFIGLWNRLKSGFFNLEHEAFQWGANLMHNFIGGIESMIGQVANAVGNVAKTVSNFLGFHSPAKEGPGADADVWMPNLMRMLTAGIEQGTPMIQAALSHVLVPPNVAGLMRQAGTRFAADAAQAIHTHAHVTVNVGAGATTDAKAVADMVLPHITHSLTQVARAGGISS